MFNETKFSFVAFQVAFQIVISKSMSGRQGLGHCNRPLYLVLFRTKYLSSFNEPRRYEPVHKYRFIFDAKRSPIKAYFNLQ